MKKGIMFACIIAMNLINSGCSAGEIKMRVSPYFGGFVSYLDPEDLGDYQFKGGKVGMLYTHKAGYIDTGHLFESVERTKYLFEIIFENLKAGNEKFSFKMVEPARYFVKVKYPDGYEDLNEDEKGVLIRESAICLAQGIAYRSTIWHEIITWYGYSCVILISEKPSSFSWEDLYSDLLGTVISAQALREGGDFDSAVTRILNEKLKRFEVQSSGVAKQATKKIRGKWFSGLIIPSMKKRNFDTGLGNGYLIPWLVPGICKDALPEPCFVSSLDSASENGFSFSVELEPVSGQGKKALQIISDDGKRLRHLDRQFLKIIRKIRKQEIKTKGRDLIKPTLEN